MYRFRDRRPLFAFVSFLFLASVCGPVFGQAATATLTGTVRDQNAAVVPGVEITIQNDATRIVRTGMTNESGSFSVPLLPPGTYTLTAARDGFAQVRVPEIVLNVGDQKSLAIQLKVGDVKTEVVVPSDASMVSTSAAVGTVVDRQFVENMPLNGRSLQSLISLTPGVQMVTDGAYGGQFSVNGQRANANIFTVDGVSGNVGISPISPNGNQGVSGNLPGLTATGGTNGLVSIDALQEFRIETSTYSAEYGRSPGGQITLVTRSGTNALNWSVFDYVRNDVFDAQNWFANRSGQPKPPMRQNNFGGTFGGPVFLPKFGDGGPGWYDGRDKTFFFFSYEGLRLRTPKFSGTTVVPTLALRQAAPDVMKPYLNAFPLPTNGTDLGNGLARIENTYSDFGGFDAIGVRLDHAVNKKISLFGRINHSPSHSTSRGPLNLANLTPAENRLMTLTLGTTFLPTSNTSNELRANYSRNTGISGGYSDDFGGAVPLPRSAYIPSQYDSPSAQGSFSILFTGSPQAATTIGGAMPDQRQINIVDNFTYVRGSHELKFGLDYRRIFPILGQRSYIGGATFRSLDEIMNSRVNSMVIAARITARPIYTNFSAFGQDTWRVSRRLTVTLGLRWEVNPPPGEADDRLPPVVRGLDDLATASLAPEGTPLWNTTWNNFAPRIGVAYSFSQKPGRETVVRGGLGVFYDTGNSLGSAGYGGFPFTPSRPLSGLSFPFDPALVAPPPFNSLTPPYGQLYTFDSLKLPYTLQWNAAVEQSLGKDQTISATYVGSAGRRLLLHRQLDLRNFNNPFTFVNVTTNGATSDYNSLQLQFQRRLSRGLQALASYTWAHAIDESSSDFVDQILERGNSNFDVRHNFSAAVSYNIPAPRTNKFVNALLRNWSLDSIVSMRSAFPLNIVSGTVIDPFDGTNYSRRVTLIPGVPIYTSDPVMPGGRGLNNTGYTNTPANIAMALAAGCAPLTFPPATPTNPNPVANNARGAFCAPPVGTNGNLGRNQVRGLGAWQVDMALRRQFNVTEKLRVQLRAEAFNVFNHPNFGSINTTITNQTFGEATNMLATRLGGGAGLNPLYNIGGPRSMQFAAKILF